MVHNVNVVACKHFTADGAAGWNNLRQLQEPIAHVHFVQLDDGRHGLELFNLLVVACPDPGHIVVAKHIHKLLWLAALVHHADTQRGVACSLFTKQPRFSLCNKRGIFANPQPDGLQLILVNHIHATPLQLRKHTQKKKQFGEGERRGLAEWSGVEWSGVEWSGVEWSATLWGWCSGLKPQERARVKCAHTYLFLLQRHSVCGKRNLSLEQVHSCWPHDILCSVEPRLGSSLSMTRCIGWLVLR